MEEIKKIEKQSGFIIFIEQLQDYALMVIDLFKNTKNIFRNIPGIMDELYLIGAQSVVIVFLSGLFMGLILSLEAGYRFQEFGAKLLVGRSVALGMIRELGPVITGILMAARTGSKNTSEIGGMVLSEQVDALRAFGTSPVEKLVLPRTIASLIMFLPLTLIADFTGLFAGMIISYTTLSLDVSIFWKGAIHGLAMRDLIVGFAKPFAFGFFISTVSCFYGLRTSGGTSGLGRALINSVVVSSMLVLLLDLIFTKVVWELM